jgi:hypothetical protein
MLLHCLLAALSRCSVTVAQMLVDMERSYITAGFFRYTMSRRFEASQSQAAVQKALAGKVCAAQQSDISICRLFLSV